MTDVTSQSALQETETQLPGLGRAPVSSCMYQASSETKVATVVGH